MNLVSLAQPCQERVPIETARRVPAAASSQALRPRRGESARCGARGGARSPARAADGRLHGRQRRKSMELTVAGLGLGGAQPVVFGGLIAGVDRRRAPVRGLRAQRRDARASAVLSTSSGSSARRSCCLTRGRRGPRCSTSPTTRGSTAAELDLPSADRHVRDRRGGVRADRLPDVVHALDAPQGADVVVLPRRPSRRPDAQRPDRQPGPLRRGDDPLRY